jgi:hypothetical protein
MELSGASAFFLPSNLWRGQVGAPGLVGREHLGYPECLVSGHPPWHQAVVARRAGQAADIKLPFMGWTVAPPLGVFVVYAQLPVGGQTANRADVVLPLRQGLPFSQGEAISFESPRLRDLERVAHPNLRRR